MKGVGIAAVKLLVAVSFTLPVLAQGQGRGLYNAPECLYDLDRNYSVAEADKAVAGVETLLATAGGGPLTHPALETARNLMTEAWSHLEQVMNQGALKFSSFCITCSPGTYLDAARRLVAVSRKVYGRPDYNEYLGLVETMENNMQRLNYCGYHANHVPNATLGGVSGRWTFGRVDGPVLCPASAFDLTLQTGPRGRVILRCNANESYYWLLGNELVFVHADGSVTSILRQGSSDYWEGPYVPHPSVPVRNVAHYIKRDQTAQGDGNRREPPDPDADDPDLGCRVLFQAESSSGEKYVIEFQHREQGRIIVVLTARSDQVPDYIRRWQREGHRVLGQTRSPSHEAAVRSACGACPTSNDPQCRQLRR